MNGTAMAVPVCPDCGTAMVKAHVQMEDGSGWVVGWLCECPHDGEPRNVLRVFSLAAGRLAAVRRGGA